MAGLYMVRFHALTSYSFPRKKLLGALRSALAAKFADGKLIIVNTFELKDAKTKQFRIALDALKVDKTVLVVDTPNSGNRNLELERAQHSWTGVDGQQRDSSLSSAEI